MAASSTSSIQRRFKYDVFLSFRGEDTRTNFVDHLYHALGQKSIDTYKDDERINKGNRISDELMGSIEDSKFYIIVFSKNYASSSWCLDELVKIMECHRTTEHTAYPVFYDVEPSEVRKQTGPVEEAFAKLEKKEAARKWREALREAADLSGWELKNTANGHEAIFIQNIVNDLSRKLRSISFSIDEKLVGMKTRIEEVVSSVGTGFDDVRMIGIKGMGGGGKTTLARAVFDQISFEFEGASFVENVREVSNSSLFGLKSLQNQILSDVFDGKHMIQKMMRNRKVLIILDDVDHVVQLEALAGETNWFKPGSSIIITTRDEQVLVAHQVKLIHNVNLLSDKEAICLFNRYAFGRNIPIQEFEELSGQVVRYASGLPLTIKVLGSFLCGKNVSEWVDALKRLKKIPLVETLEKLELSYTCLEEDYKEIFLDIACFLKGWDKDLAIQVLESCGFHATNGLRVLEQKSPISIHHECLGMHDHIEEMGRNIVRRSHPDKPHKHSRLWIGQEIEDILANDLGTKATRCIQFYTAKLNPDIVINLGKMKKLRFLSVVLGDGFRHLESNIASPQFPNALQYLDFNRYPFRSLPETFQADNLVTIKMAESRIIQLWEGGVKKVLKKLRYLDLSRSMLRTLDLGLAPNLEELILIKCIDLGELLMPSRCLYLRSIRLNNSKLRTLDIKLTPNLENLDLENCSYLEELHMANECQKLVNIYITHSKLRILNLGMTPNLKTLVLTKCCNLIELITPNGCPKELAHLDVSGGLEFRWILFDLNDSTFCSGDELLGVGPLAELHLTAEPLIRCLLHPNETFFSVDELLGVGPLAKFRFSCFYKEDRPSMTRNLGMLISVCLCACTNIETILGTICRLQRLRKLKLEGSILEAPKDLNRLECLEELIFSSTKINRLPDSICMLKYLKSLELISCLLLEELPKDLGQLECLEIITLSSTSKKRLPDCICLLKRLKSLYLILCWFLVKLPDDVGQLGCLEYLTISSTMIKHLPHSICMLKHLKSLELISSRLLEKLPEDLGRLECLEKLTLTSTKIKHIPDSICMLKHLKSLKLNDCLLLEKLPDDLGQLECLEELDLSCTKIEHLPDSICMLKHLESLQLHHCWLLEKLPEDLSQLECLEKLSLKKCESLQDIPNSICDMKCLKHINLYNCTRVEKLPEEIGRLECLKQLDIIGTSISHIPQSILLVKGLRITGSRRVLQSCGFTSEIHTSEYQDTFCIVGFTSYIPTPTAIVTKRDAEKRMIRLKHKLDTRRTRRCD